MCKVRYAFESFPYLFIGIVKAVWCTLAPIESFSQFSEKLHANKKLSLLLSTHSSVDTRIILSLSLFELYCAEKKINIIRFLFLPQALQVGCV